MTIKDIIKLLPAKKEMLPMSTDYRHGKSTQHGIWCYNQAIANCISALSKITCSKCKELETIIEAWHTAFGTTQLTHALDRLETAERKIPKPEGKGLLQQKYVARCKELEAKVSEYRMALETLLELAMSCKRAGLKDMKIDGVIDIVTKGE